MHLFIHDAVGGLFGWRHVSVSARTYSWARLFGSLTGLAGLRWFHALVGGGWNMYL